jgi:hypothetical protein
VHFQTYSARLIATLIVGATLTLVLGATSALAGPSSGGIGYGSESEAQPSGSGSSGGADNRTPSKYNRLWDRVSPDDRDWARKVSWCESGRDPDALGLGGQYRGAFMFTRDAWKTSPKTPGGDPIDYSYRTQAVVAVALKKRDGTRPWPVCG